MAQIKPEPNVYFPGPGESVEPMIQAIYNVLMTDEERKAEAKKIDKGRVAQPKKGKGSKEKEVKIEE